jgi:hypothetical protein
MAELRIIGSAEEIEVIAAALRHGLSAHGKHLTPHQERGSRRTTGGHLHAVTDVEPTLPGLTAGGGR